MYRPYRISEALCWSTAVITSIVPVAAGASCWLRSYKCMKSRFANITVSHLLYPMYFSYTVASVLFKSSACVQYIQNSLSKYFLHMSMYTEYVFLTCCVSQRKSPFGLWCYWPLSVISWFVNQWPTTASMSGPPLWVWPSPGSWLSPVLCLHCVAGPGRSPSKYPPKGISY